jgi:hypothetical protein
MTLKELKEDPKAELFNNPRYDTYYYSKLKYIGVYHGEVDKAIIQRIYGRISMLKIRDKGYIDIDGKRMYLKYFEGE